MMFLKESECLIRNMMGVHRYHQSTPEEKNPLEENLGKFCGWYFFLLNLFHPNKAYTNIYHLNGWV